VQQLQFRQREKLIPGIFNTFVEEFFREIFFGKGMPQGITYQSEYAHGVDCGVKVWAVFQLLHGILV
jgi:hypothetical protein